MWHVSFVRIAAWDEDCAAYNGGMHMRQGREPRMNGNAGAGSP
jgi:hypothetical protein